MNAQPQKIVSTLRGRRGRSRLRTSLPAQITSLLGTYNVVLEDISLTGARVCIVDRRGNTETPRAKALLVLEWFGFDAFGEVTWRMGDRLGIAFEQIIAPAVLIKTRDMEDEQLGSRKAREEMRSYMENWSSGKVR